MADYLVLLKTPEKTGPSAWSVINKVNGKTADEAGATAALVESYQGPGKYGVIRADNARTVTVAAEPKLTPDASPNF